VRAQHARIDVVGISPNRASIIRLLCEMIDGWTAIETKPMPALEKST
jgi:hypothetical protein